MRTSLSSLIRPVRLRLGAALLAAAGMAACNSATEPEGLRTTFALGVGFVLRAPIGVTAPGTISVHWALRTPCAPYDASARSSLVAGTITLTVIGKATGPCPQDIVATLPYHAQVTRIPAGQYQVRVVHRYADVAWPEETVLEQTLDIP